MENEIKLFTNENWSVRTIGSGKDAKFCLTDVAKCLEYVNTSDAIKRFCRKDTELIPTQARNQYGAAIMVNMKWGGMGCVFSLIMKSHAKRAEEFQDWVCHEVLPALYFDGRYEMQSNEQSPVSVSEKALMTFMTATKETIKAIADNVVSLKQQVADLENYTTEIADEVIAMKKKVNVAYNKQKAEYMSQLPPALKALREPRNPLDLCIVSYPSAVMHIIKILTDFGQTISTTRAKDGFNYSIIVINYDEDAKEAIESLYGKNKNIQIYSVKHEDNEVQKKGSPA